MKGCRGHPRGGFSWEAMLTRTSVVFYKGYSEEELVRVKKALVEEARKLPAFEQTDDDVGIKMVAWIGYAWK